MDFLYSTLIFSGGCIFKSSNAEQRAFPLLSAAQSHHTVTWGGLKLKYRQQPYYILLYVSMHVVIGRAYFQPPHSML